MTDSVNGANPPAEPILPYRGAPAAEPILQYKRSVVIMGGCCKLVYTALNGDWMGEITYMTTDPKHLRVMAQDFLQAVVESTSPIKKANALPTGAPHHV
jgi:hypothetical protein